MRDSTSPTRSPPRAMQMIWLNLKPDSYTVSASRSTSALYSSQVTFRLIAASPLLCIFERLTERVVNQNCFVAIGSRRYHRNRHAGQRLDPLQVCAGIGRQRRERLRADRRI